MVSEDILEKGTREFSKGLDRLDLAQNYYDSSLLACTGARSKKNQRQETKDKENAADFVARAIDILLKAMAYIYIPDIDPIDVRGHRQTNVIELLRSNYDIAPELKEIDDTFDSIAGAAYLIHDFIGEAAYEGCAVYNRTLDRFFEYANSLKTFGIKYGLNDFDKFIRLHKENKEEN